MNKSKTGFIQYDEFLDIVRAWGFDASEALIRDLFEWLDSDKDNRISYDDLRSTAGQDLSPMEQLFFRQDVKPAKNITCKYEKCWENNNFNSKSQFCQLHQKIMRNLCLDKFAQVALNAEDFLWEDIVRIITASNFEMKIQDISNVLTNILGIRLTNKEKESIWETFKIKHYLEDNHDDVN